MKYEDLPKHIRRYSFKSKMMVCFQRSSFLYPLMLEKAFEKIRNREIPEELETIAMFSLFFDEWDGPAKPITGKEYDSIIQAVRDLQNPHLYSVNEDKTFLEKLFPSIGGNQFWWQGPKWNVYFRFYSYFSMNTKSLNMKQIFQSFYQIDFERFVQFAWMMGAYCEMISSWKYQIATTVEEKQRHFNRICEYYSDVVILLSNTREQDQKAIKASINDIYDLSVCLRPLATYPFVDYEGEKYLPIIYMIRPAVTESLMYRIVDSDNSIKSALHEVYEKYLFEILQNCGQFDEVFSEFEYGKEHKKTLDVLARSGNIFLLLDSKSFTPKKDLRIYDDTARSSDIKRIAEAIKQVYKHVSKEFGNYYNPFSTKVTDRNNVYGLVVVQSDAYIISYQYYDEAAKILNILPESDEYCWLCHHVVVISLNILENYLFTSTNIINEFKLGEKDTYIYMNKQPTNSAYTYDPIIKFKDRIKEEIDNNARDIFK